MAARMQGRDNGSGAAQALRRTLRDDTRDLVTLPRETLEGVLEHLDDRCARVAALEEELGLPPQVGPSHVGKRRPTRDDAPEAQATAAPTQGKSHRNPGRGRLW